MKPMLAAWVLLLGSCAAVKTMQSGGFSVDEAHPGQREVIA